MPLIQLFHWILIHTCVVGTVPQNVVRGVEGQSVVLPCRYNVRQSGGLTDMCWGRGSCPNSKCSEEILHTNGRRVMSRISSRYDLKGGVTNGDVSLTITKLNERDRGLYCCRIEIRGWFNDIKNTLTLQVERATTTVPTTTTTTTTITTTTTTATTTTTQITTPKITTVPLTTTVNHSTPLVPFLTTIPPPPTISTAITRSTAATSSSSTAIGFPKRTLPFVNMESLSATLQDKSAESIGHLFTTEMSSFATVATPTPTTLPMLNTTETLENSAVSAKTLPKAMLTTSMRSLRATISPARTAFLSADPSSLATPTTAALVYNEPSMMIWGVSKYYAVLIVCVLVLCGLLLTTVIKLMQRRTMRKYQLAKIKSLIKQEEEPEQTSAESQGENGFFPL